MEAIRDRGERRDLRRLGGLQQNTAALAEASAFAETITRNMALYAPLRRVDPTGPRAIAL